MMPINPRLPQAAPGSMVANPMSTSAFVDWYNQFFPTAGELHPDPAITAKFLATNPGPGFYNPQKGVGVTINPSTPPPGGNPLDPAAAFNAPLPGQTPGNLPPLNTKGVNPYLKDPLMAAYSGQNNPFYAPKQTNDYFGDKELFRPAVANP